MSEELSYDQIVDHILQDKSVPNVVKVPDIVLEDSMRSESVMRPRNKPWETTNSNDKNNVSSKDNVTGISYSQDESNKGENSVSELEPNE